MNRKNFSALSIQTQHEKISYFEHEDFIAGTAPFLRGIEATQFLKKILTTQLLVNFSSPKKSNTFIKEHISAGYKAIILDVNTSPDKTSGILITSIDEMKLLLEGISLNELSITLTTKNAILTVLALFIAATKQLGIAKENLNLSVNYNLKNAIINTKFQQNILESILKYSKKHLPKFSTISISAFQPSNIKTIETELAYFLAEAYENITNCISKGMLLDAIAPKISFNCAIEDDHFLEISKMRAARFLWAKMMYQFHPKQQQSLALQIHALQNFSNYHKVLSAFLGGAQSVISNKNTVLLIENETAITKTVDPWAGSTFVEKTTEEISKNTWALFNELLNNGGFSQKINSENKINLIKEIEEEKEFSLELIIKAAEKNATIHELNSYYS
jgi:methylmalonyl-CoA mutase cobalamin-binding domain/chain